jgi:hypothetical protein
MRSIKASKSQAYQESFVLNVLNFKFFGTFLELGAGDGIEASNTFLLENKFNWKGLSLEYDREINTAFKTMRRTECLCEDATKWEAIRHLERRDFPKQIDYLQIDVDPAKQSLETLVNLPLGDYRFSTITFEHDYYVEKNPEVRDASRTLLRSLNYHLFFAGVQTNGRNFEDWWIDKTIPGLKRYQNFYFEDMEASMIFTEGVLEDF